MRYSPLDKTRHSERKKNISRVEPYRLTTSWTKIHLLSVYIVSFDITASLSTTAMIRILSTMLRVLRTDQPEKGL